MIVYIVVDDRAVSLNYFQGVVPMTNGGGKPAETKETPPKDQGKGQGPKQSGAK